MKRFLILTLVCASTVFSTVAQDNNNKTIPSTEVRSLDGKKVAFNSTFEKGKVTLVSFWATWCIPCKLEIKNIKTKKADWAKEADFNFMAVSIDDSRAMAQVKTYAKTQGWDFPVYIDMNSDLKRSLNFSNVPFTIIVDGEGKVVFQHSGYEEGGEEEIFAKLKELAPKSK